MAVLAPSRVTRLLAVMTCGLALAGVVGQVAKYAWGYVDGLGLIPAFDLGGERNIPSWVSSALMFTNALAAGWLARESLDDADPDAWRWVVLCLFCGWCSLDEIVGIHESWTRPLREALNLSGILYYGWVVPGLAVIAALLAVFWKFMRRLQPATCLLLIVAAFLYFGGAIGVEMVSGYYHSHVGKANLVYALMVAVEETLELFGMTALLEALLTELHARRVVLRVEMTRS